MEMLNKTPIKISGDPEPKANLVLKIWYINKFNALTGYATILVGAWANSDVAKIPDSVVQYAKDEEGNDLFVLDKKGNPTKEKQVEKIHSFDCPTEEPLKHFTVPVRLTFPITEDQIWGQIKSSPELAAYNLA